MGAEGKAEVVVRDHSLAEPVEGMSEIPEYTDAELRVKRDEELSTMLGDILDKLGIEKDEFNNLPDYGAKSSRLRKATSEIAPYLNTGKTWKGSDIPWHNVQRTEKNAKLIVQEQNSRRELKLPETVKAYERTMLAAMINAGSLSELKQVVATQSSQLPSEEHFSEAPWVHQRLQHSLKMTGEAVDKILEELTRLGLSDISAPPGQTDGRAATGVEHETEPGHQSFMRGVRKILLGIQQGYARAFHSQEAVNRIEIQLLIIPDDGVRTKVASIVQAIRQRK